MTTAPGADERRIRSLLKGRGVGYAPQPADAPAPAPASADWWADLYDDTHTDHHRPPQPPRMRDRLPNWRKGERAELIEPEPEAEPEDEPAAEEQDDPEWVETTDPDDPATRRPGTPPNPRRASARGIQDAYASLDSRWRFLLYNGGAAGAGWALGLEPLLNGWITACHHDTGSVTAALFVGAGMVVAAGLGIDRRSRCWWGPLPWLMRIPLASAVLAVLLFAPGAAS
jgi:hypothetical protein